MIDKHEPPTTQQEADALKSLLNHPGWRVYTLAMAGLQNALIKELQQAVRETRVGDAKACQKTLDFVTLMLEVPDTLLTSAEVMIARLLDSRRTDNVR